MPPILDVAIGTIFVFLLFSIVVTALNEIVLSFFDKRADFLRLGLGELLADPQAEVVRTYLDKIRAFSVSRVAGMATWVLGLPFVAFFIGAPEWVPVALGVLVAIVFVVIKNSQPTSSGAALEEASNAEIKVDTLLQHPLIFSLSKGKTDPSYIGASPFSQAIIDMLVPAVDADGKIGSATAPTSAQVRAAIEAITNQKLRASLATLFKGAEGDVEKFRTAVEAWFDRSMVRVTGWYKRHAQTWLLVLSLGLAVACNVDGIRIVQTLSKNPNLAKSVAAQAESYAKANGAPPTEAEEKKIHTEKDAKVAAARKKRDEERAVLAKSPTEENARNLAKAEKELDSAIGLDERTDKFHQDLKALAETGIPMGWDQEGGKKFNIIKPMVTGRIWERVVNGINPLDEWNWQYLFAAICGWLLTAIAASLGAPFWFDLLQRFMNLRANGRSPDEKQLGTKKEPREPKPESEIASGGLPSTPAAPAARGGALAPAARAKKGKGHAK